MRTLASPYKIAWHKEKFKDALAGRNIFPATVEMDITTACNAGCHNCPSTRSPEAKNLSMEIVDRLFGSLAGETKGLLLSGGEPTQAASFGQTLALARKHGFEDVTIVTNGSQLDRKQVQTALLRDASAVRVSLYGWDDGASETLRAVFASIENLRNQIQKDQVSDLQIGVSLLTSQDMVHKLPEIASSVRDCGAHWLYLHPKCTGWGTGTLGQEEQGDLTAQHEALEGIYNDFQILLCPARYEKTQLYFDAYYTSQFLLVVGADGKIYLGTESKYQPHGVVGSIDYDWDTEDLWSESRWKAINSAKSDSYTAAGGRHRGILYSDLIQSVIDGKRELEQVLRQAEELELGFPHVL